MSEKNEHGTTSVKDNFTLPKPWQDKVDKLAKEKASSRAQLYRNAIYETYIREAK
jgi:predicted transcriptional regulator